MQNTHVIGVDPGLVHTGVVHLWFDVGLKKIDLTTSVFDGLNPRGLRDEILDKMVVGSWLHYCMVEDYKPRKVLNTDRDMVQFIGALKTETRGYAVKYYDNMGVKQVVRRPLMELLHVWSFSTKTHHQDLRSAARIALFGMLKSDDLNEILTRVVIDHLNGDTWIVT